MDRETAITRALGAFWQELETIYPRSFYQGISAGTFTLLRNVARTAAAERLQSLHDHERPAQSLVIRTNEGSAVEVLPGDAPGLFDEWEAWTEAQAKAVAESRDWLAVLGAADAYLESRGGIDTDETAEDVRAI